MTDELVTWLRGVLDEDEENARYETGDHYEDARNRWMLADIAAKRAVLDAIDAPVTTENVEDYEGLWRAVTLLASAYADRPGYQGDEWRPA